jgi:hypothetical protein
LIPARPTARRPKDGREIRRSIDVHRPIGRAGIVTIRFDPTARIGPDAPEPLTIEEGPAMMIRPTCLICLLAAGALGLPSRAAEAGMINAVVVGGPGGSATTDIDNANPGGPTDYFNATFTSVAPIDFTVTIDRPGNFYLSFAYPAGSVLNDTGVTIAAIEFRLLDPAAGAFISGVQRQVDTPLSALIFVGSYGAEISGAPGLAPGASTAFGIGFDIPNGTGPQTVIVELTPIVPGPSAVVMTAMGMLALAGFGLRRRRAGARGAPATSG